MTAAQARILGEISGLLCSVTDSLPPGEEITMETIFIDDLEMNSLQMANLTGRIAAFYGFKADLVPFYAGREAGPFHGLRVGEMVDHLAGVLDDGEAAAVQDAPEPTVTAPARMRMPPVGSAASHWWPAPPGKRQRSRAQRACAGHRPEPGAAGRR